MGSPTEESVMQISEHEILKTQSRGSKTERQFALPGTLREREVGDLLTGEGAWV